MNIQKLDDMKKRIEATVGGTVIYYLTVCEENIITLSVTYMGESAYIKDHNTFLADTFEKTCKKVEEFIERFEARVYKLV